MSWIDRYNIDKTASNVSKETYESGNMDDAMHVHLIRLLDGTVVSTEPSSGHRHAAQHESNLPLDGAHSHLVKLPSGDLVETRTDGMHRHNSHSNSGIHSHLLSLPDGSIIETQIDGPHYHYYVEDCDDMPAMEKVAKQLPAGVGPEITDQSGWTTTFVDAPPKLPASTSLYFDTEETVTKAREVVADLKTRIGGK